MKHRNYLLNCLSLIALFWSGSVLAAPSVASPHGKKAVEMYTLYQTNIKSLSYEEQVSQLKAVFAEAEKGVPKNDRLAMALVGVFLQDVNRSNEQVIIPADLNRAFSLLKQSYDMGEVEAANGLVKAYANGWGVTRDRVLASTLIGEAIVKGCTDCSNLQAELNQGSGPNLEYYKEQSAGCTSPKNKRYNYTLIEVPCVNGQFTGHGKISWRANKDKESCVYTGYIVNGFEDGKGQRKCEALGRTFTDPEFVNGRITMVQKEIVGGTHIMTGGFSKGNREGFNEYTGPRNVYQKGTYAKDKLITGYGIDSDKLAFFVSDNKFIGLCSADFDAARDKNCSEINRKIAFPLEYAANLQKATEDGRGVAGQTLGSPINCSDYSYSKVTALPTESSGQFALCSAIKNALGSSQFRFVSFRKIDGLSALVNGVSVYTMQYEAEIEYTADLRPECYERMSFMRYPQCGQAVSAGGISARGNALPNIARAGAKIKRKGDITFTKYESGWKYNTPSGL